MLCFGIVCLSKGNEDDACGFSGTVRHPVYARRATAHRAHLFDHPQLLSRIARLNTAGRRNQHDGDGVVYHRLLNGKRPTTP